MEQTGEITLNKIPELLKKIDLISNDDYEQLTSIIHETLKASIEGKTKPSDKQLPYLDSLVDLYIQSPSERVLKILVGLPTPLNEHLFTILLNKITSYNNNVKNRQSVLILISKIVHVTPVWLSQIITQNRLTHFFSILKNDEEVVTLGTSALIIVEMIATLPSVMSQCLGEIFNFFSRLADFVYKCQLNHNDANFLHMNAILYRFFFRLYAMYPCNFVSFLQDHYGLGCNEKNGVIFNQTIEPMLSNFRFHPLLISSSKEKECDKERWFYKEAHDHVDDCLRYAIDPIEYFSEANELCNEENYSDDDADDDEELCQLTNSTPDEDKLTPTTPVSREKQFSSETSNVENEPNRNTIFNKLNEKITNDWRNVTLLEKSDSQPETGAAVKVTAEFAEEAISLSSKKASLKNGAFESAQKLSPMRSTNKPVLAPVAINPVSKTHSSGALQRKILNKQVCVSPFKPIKENDSYDIKSLTTKSPADFHSDSSHSLQRAKTSPTTTSRDSANSNTICSIEQIFSANSYESNTEEGWRRQMMFMTLHLMFERHQRDLVVIRNRRLYKKLKEFIKLEEQLHASRKRIEQMEKEQGLLEKNLKEKLYDYCNYRKTMKSQLVKTENELNEFKGKCHQLEIELSQMEKRYTEEIKSLQENYRMIDTELKKYQTSFEEKNADLVKLSDENSNLKRRLFVYGEFYNKLRDSYMQNRNVTADLNDKFCLDALKHDNSVLNKQIAELNCQLLASKDKIIYLEKKLKQQEAQTRMRMESQDTQYFQDLLKTKDNQIASLKSIIINFEKHIHALNGQINDR